MAQVSIIVPVYNAAVTLSQTVESILNQSYEDWELLLIDDCSTDNSKKLCEDFASADNRIRVIGLLKNSGPAAVRNVGLENAQGEFIAFVDSDDVISEEFLFQMLCAQHKFQADIIWCNYANVSIGTLPVNTSHNLLCFQPLSKEVLLNLFVQETIGLGSTWNKLYRKSFIVHNKIKFNEERVRAEDWEFNLMLFNCSPVVYAIPDVLYFYIHQNKSSVMASYRSKDFDLMIRSYNLLKHIFNSNGFEMNVRALNTSLYIGIMGHLQLFIKSKQSNYADFSVMVHNAVFQNAILNLNYKGLSRFFRISYLFLKFKLYRFFYLFMKLILKNNL